MLRLIDKIIFIISILAIFGLLGAYSASYINPNTFVFPSLLGLAYPFLLISNILLFFYWVFRWKRMAWFELLALLAGLSVFTSYFGTASSSESNQKGQLSIISYNVRYFDLYNWSNQKDTQKKLLNYLKQFPGDVICLQESHLNDKSKLKQTFNKMLASYSHRYFYKSMTILSRYPILNKGALIFKNSSSGSCIYCDLLCSKDTIRVYNVHLESFKLGKEERQFMKEISQGLKGDEFPEGAKRLTSRLVIGNKNRASQAEIIKEHIHQSPYPVVICGDFNDTPLSYTYRKIKRGLKDAFIEKGRGLGQTYVGEFPSFRIDFILHSKQLETVGYQRDLVEFSDHYPIQAQLNYRN